MEDNESKQMKYFVMNMYDLVSAYNMWLSRSMPSSDKAGYIASHSQRTYYVDLDRIYRFLLRNLISISDNSFPRSIKLPIREILETVSFWLSKHADFIVHPPRGLYQIFCICFPFLTVIYCNGLR